MRIFALKTVSPTERVIIDSGAAHSACPSDYANEHERFNTRFNFQPASGELLEIMVRNSNSKNHYGNHVLNH